ncbi:MULTISPECIES: hypothetical protein [unclassified Sporosarcina]|uniref:MutS-related protein n=1 Tax=unclassified Sporosarcina TaxID=2647733 RepID=UPI0020410C14|nr:MULTISPECIES: hypothetical protein [unclassified Sporosarcina]GKV65119.1 DNA mismatch repair protein MutS [Sporosarcina sp. NCCP-2331]GLB55243.1 DNA mismatch repair protein MutS [Sporosarcina sp. NCCP-2378]
MENPVILVAIISFFIIITYLFLTGNRQKLKQLRKEWESETYTAIKEDANSISSYWDNKKNFTDCYAGVDQLTWDDLAMQEIFEKLNYTKSSLGSEYLFNQLRDIDPKIVDVTEKEELYTLLANDHKLREKVLLILSSLGKRNYADTSSYFYKFNDSKIKNDYIYIILSCLPILSIIFMFFNLKYGAVSLFSSFVINLVIYYRNKTLLENDLHSITYAAAIVNTGKSLASVQHPRFIIYKDIFKGEGKGLKVTSFWGRVLSIGGNRGGDFDVLYEYFRIIFLLDFIAYNQIVKTLFTYPEAYQQLWESIGELDAAIAVAFYRKRLSLYTTPKFVEEEELLFEDLAHPLLDNPITNSSRFGKCVLITGSNASGKSTYIKAIAINAILAQTINTVLAKSWTMKPSYIVTSMAIQDNVLRGDSYFIAEIKSLKRIIRLSEEKKPIISFIDEILKGTNTVERISASAAIMEWLSVNQGMIIIASHDIELTEIAKGVYRNYHFRESIEKNKVSFDYKVHNGPSITRNAIKLLEVLDYPKSVTVQANQLAQHFTEVHEWNRLSSQGYP